MPQHADRVPRSNIQQPETALRGRESLSAPGTEPLPGEVRHRMEAWFGEDFSRIRVSSAPQSAEGAGARALTRNDRLWFADGEYRPGTRDGDALIAHELAHHVQQRGSTHQAHGEPPAYEREADAVAAGLAAGTAVPRLSRRVGRRVQRKPPDTFAVVPSMEESDRTRNWLDPADRAVKPVWTPELGYAKNPTARKLSTLVENGRIAGGFQNGQFTYVVDTDGEVWVAKRLGEPGGRPGRATGMPHPTLIGGKKPEVLAAGELEVRGGRVYKIDNQSGHFQPGRATLSRASKAFFKLPTSVFHPEFRMESVHFDAAGARTTRAFRSLNMLRLRLGDFRRALRMLNPQAVRGRMRSARFRAGARTAAGIVAMLLIEYIASRIKGSLEDQVIQQQMEKLAPQIEAKLAAQGDQLDALLAEDSDAEVCLNVRFDIITVQTRTYDQGGVTPADMLPVIQLTDTGFSRVPWDQTPVHSTHPSCGSTSHVTSLAFSERFMPKDLFTDIDAARSPADGGQQGVAP
ncbi:DUF4157 domain-containing protein [Streptomyces sp. NBC_00038]|uniref:eCIS core domain-containing protein n=1 Tax=Streptomyces sp. NBC_00038 TaxID=2903615 RepID=UPI0022571146|nr:DUF4157 domain-containing protein [Streptomyces sp. NBC_00038]MCX5557531.1 DUF4157 domain-containing protein [Streptomyces sp. NBC_00038]